MDRRRFLASGSAAFAGLLIRDGFFNYEDPLLFNKHISAPALFDLFRNPGTEFHPFIRWWWNGDKVEAEELIRELRLLKVAGIGGVEINPIEFPARFDGDDLGKPSLKWLSPEWIDLLKIVFVEASSLGMTCDLIVGSGWPFGAEYLEGENRSQVVVIAVKKITGPIEYEISQFEIFKEADPEVSSPFPGRTMELLSLYLVPDPLSDIGRVKDLSEYRARETIKITIPKGKYALYGLVKINGFMQVINGAPGATGPVLNHFNQNAVRTYLEHMSDTIEKRTGPLSENIRALFTDSMELEGANWSEDMMDGFRKRRGYDIYPYLPFILFRTGGMGNISDFKYGVGLSPEFEKMICRMRYDFEVTKAEILEERFITTYTGWCRDLSVKSRAQAYGRGLFPLEGSFMVDIPECESWTMNWLKHKVGEEMPEDDYRRGRAYTMINKYVSSSANLTGKRVVSCEEMTDTYTVFNTSLENLKIGGDQTVITGVTHSVFHGFNYSPPEAPYPGWIRYGAYYNENNTWWPYFHLYNEYKARIAAVLQHSVMYADIAILPPNDDMWSLIGMQMEPFPNITHIDWFTLVWEAINKNGDGCDYVSQRIIRDSEIKNGYLQYGPRKYSTLFLVSIDSLDPPAAKKMFDFVSSGGRIFCVESIPSSSTGWKDHDKKDAEVRDYINKMKAFPDRFILLKKPGHDFIKWYSEIQEQYKIIPYIKIEKPDPYIMQIRRTADDGSEILFIINSHINESRNTRIIFSKDLTDRKYCWKWDPETGDRFMITPDSGNGITLDMGPAESFLFVFDYNKKGVQWKPLPVSGDPEIELLRGWGADFIHCREKSKYSAIDELMDLRDDPELVNFAGIIIYSIDVDIINPADYNYINLGKVFGTSELIVNGKSCGTRWYGRRIFETGRFLKEGANKIEVKVTTSMGNYMKSLTDNPIAQYWTNEKNKVQPLQSMGLIGPVVVY